MSPFTASQWQELEEQALMYKYIVSGLPIPPHLLCTLNKEQAFSSSSSSSSSFSYSFSLFASQPSHVGWRCYERKVDPEQWRCRRTDGKKWRCSKEAYNESKYCKKHMHRGKNRPRKLPSFTSTTTTDLLLASGSWRPGGSGDGGASSFYTNNNLEIFRRNLIRSCSMKNGVGGHEHVLFATEPSGCSMKTMSGYSSSSSSSSSKQRNVLMSRNNEYFSYLQLQSSCNEQQSHVTFGDTKLIEATKCDREDEGENEEHRSTTVYRFF